MNSKLPKLAQTRALSFYEALIAQKLVAPRSVHQLNMNWGDGCLFWRVCSKPKSQILSVTSVVEFCGRESTGGRF